MRTLFLSEMIPYPLDTAINQRIYHLLKSVASVSEVTLVCFLRNESERAYVEDLRPLCREIHCIPADRWGHRNVFKRPRPIIWAHALAGYLHPTLPVQLRWYKSEYAKCLVAELCSRSFDLIWAERPVCMKLLPSDTSARVIIDLADLEHRKLAYRLCRTGWYRLKPFDFLEYLKFRRLEKGLLKSSYEFAVCSAIDQAVLGEPKRVWVVPNGINLPRTQSQVPAEDRDPTFLFMGSMSYDPNVDGICYFANRIFPLIRRQLQNARLLIVGRDPVQAVRRLHNGESIFVTGGVQDMQPYLEQATATVVPLRFGGGTRIKILEAMAHKRPVVSTTIGAEGLDIEPNVDFLRCDDPQEFARACVMLWRDPQLRTDLAGRAYRLVSNEYTWDRISVTVQEIVAGCSVRASVPD